MRFILDEIERHGGIAYTHELHRVPRNVLDVAAMYGTVLHIKKGVWAAPDLDPLVVVDFFLSETAERADVLLPGAVWCEDEGTTTNLEGRVIKIKRAAPPPGEARTDWEILCDLALRLGKERWFPFRNPREIWDELRTASRGGVADYFGITWERIEAEDSPSAPPPARALDPTGCPVSR